MRGRLRRIVVIGAVVIMLPLCSQAQTAALDEVKSLVDKGVIAAEQKDWAVALKYFYDAVNASMKSDPSAQSFYPPIALNIALAHVQVGNELAAMLWFRVYLAAAPTAPNTATVRNEIARMEVALQSKIRRLLDDATRTAQAGKYASTDRGNQEVLGFIALARARTGEVQTAERIASGIDKLMTLDDTSLADHIGASYAWSLARRGEFDSAAGVLARVKKPGRAFGKRRARPLRFPFEETTGGSREDAEDRFWLAVLGGHLVQVDFEKPLAEQISVARVFCAVNDTAPAKALVSRIKNERRRAQLTELLAQVETLPCTGSALGSWLHVAMPASSDPFVFNLPETLKASSECAFTHMKERIPCIVPMAASHLFEWAQLEQTFARRLARPGIGRFPGIGVAIGRTDSTLITGVVPGGPGDRAGLRPDDEIVEVDGVPVHRQEDTISRLRGPEGTTVTIKIRRGVEILSVTVKRELIVYK